MKIFGSIFEAPKPVYRFQQYSSYLDCSRVSTVDIDQVNDVWVWGIWSIVRRLKRCYMTWSKLNWLMSRQIVLKTKHQLNVTKGKASIKHCELQWYNTANKCISMTRMYLPNPELLHWHYSKSYKQKPQHTLAKTITDQWDPNFTQQDSTATLTFSISKLIITERSRKQLALRGF